MDSFELLSGDERRERLQLVLEIGASQTRERRRFAVCRPTSFGVGKKARLGCVESATLAKNLEASKGLDEAGWAGEEEING